MNIIIGQNESLPNIKGAYNFELSNANVVGDKYRFEGAFNCSRDRVTKQSLPAVSSSKWSGSYLTFDASEGGTKSVWRDDAEVKTRNFTYKNWARIF